MNCLATREMAAVLVFYNCRNAKQFIKMKKQNHSPRGRYVSADKIQQLFANLGIELSSGRKRIRATRSDKSISIYVNGGTVNITFNEKGNSHE